jgi:hypothetical protein
VAVLFCYFANASLFVACLALHGRRVYSKRHTYTCRPTEPVSTLIKEMKHNACYACLCGGAPPEGRGGDHSILEKLPSVFFSKLFMNSTVSIIIIIIFLGYLAAAIYGTSKLKQGLLLQDLVLDTSYHYKYLVQSDQYFPNRIPIAFAVTTQYNYEGNSGDQFLNLLATAQQDASIDSNFTRCWLQSFRNSSMFGSATPVTFIGKLLTFLAAFPQFQPDVVLDSSNSSVMASRCFVLSTPNSDNYENAELMKRMREVAEKSSVPAIAYHAAFVAFEQFLAVLPATLQLVGIAVAVMTVVTFLLLPHPFMVLLIVVCIVMILVGIFGFMHFWGLTLSSITMIHLVMSVGFSVDFSAHVCTAYLLSGSPEEGEMPHRKSRKQRASDAITHAAAPIFNCAISTLLGILLLLASTSYIFQSFFKVMVLVIGLGLVHAVFFLPAVLSLLGPEIKPPTNTRGKKPRSADGISTKDVDVHVSRTSTPATSDLEAGGEEVPLVQRGCGVDNPVMSQDNEVAEKEQAVHTVAVHTGASAPSPGRDKTARATQHVTTIKIKPAATQNQENAVNASENVVGNEKPLNNSTETKPTAENQETTVDTSEVAEEEKPLENSTETKPAAENQETTVQSSKEVATNASKKPQKTSTESKQAAAENSETAVQSSEEGVDHDYEEPQKSSTETKPAATENQETAVKSLEEVARNEKTRKASKPNNRVSPTPLATESTARTPPQSTGSSPDHTKSTVQV